MDIGDAKIKISADDEASAKLKGVGTSMDDLGKKATKAGALMMAAGVAIAAGIFKMADSYTKAGDEVAKMAKRTGFGTEALSELRHAANLSGSALESIEKGVKRMASTIEDAKDGLETYTKSFDKLGLSVDEVAAMQPEEQFWAIAEALAGLEDQTMKSALAQDFFGRAGTDLLPMLAAGTEGIAAMRQEAHTLGIVFDEEAAANAEKFQDAITILKGSLAGLGAEIIDDLIPILEEYIEKATDIIGKMSDWAAVHPDLAKNILILAGVLVGAGGLLVALGMIAKAIIAVNTAFAIMHGLAGPAGWAKMAAGLAIAAGTIYGMNKLLNWEPGEPEVTLPPMAAGGIVPGSFGSPVPILAHGGELVSGLHGEAMGGTTINVEVGTFVGNESAFQEFARTIDSAIKQNGRRTSFGTVNDTYFGGTSGP